MLYIDHPIVSIAFTTIKFDNTYFVWKFACASADSAIKEQKALQAFNFQKVSSAVSSWCVFVFVASLFFFETQLGWRRKTSGIIWVFMQGESENEVHEIDILIVYELGA